MSGHSKWSTIKRQKGVKDAAKGAIFTKLGNALAVAARLGSDPETNFALKLAIDKAKSFNMPQANIQRAIDRVKEKESSNLQELIYEGYGPGGVAILVQVMTDNINRTYPEVKLAFSKHGGSIAEKGAVLFLFKHLGTIRIDGNNEENILTCLDCGAIDVIEEDNHLLAITETSELTKVRDCLISKNLTILEAELSYIPSNLVKIDDPEVARKILNLLNALEDNPDVLNTFVNFEFSDQIAGSI